MSRLENGLQGFRSATLTRMAKVLGVPPTYFSLEVESDKVSQNDVAEALDDVGLTPSRTLVAAMKDERFLKFLEKCAKAIRSHKKNLVRMTKALQKIV